MILHQYTLYQTVIFHTFSYTLFQYMTLYPLMILSAHDPINTLLTHPLTHSLAHSLTRPFRRVDGRLGGSSRPLDRAQRILLFLQVNTSTHPFNIPINTSSHYSISTHLIYSTSTYPIKISYRHILSSHLIIATISHHYYQHTFSY